MKKSGIKNPKKPSVQEFGFADSESNSFRFYLREVSSIPLMSREEESAAAREAAGGNQAARDKLVRANLRFVVKIAKKYQGMGLPLEDLISEGNIGLVYAAKRYDIERGCHFISYAVWWIRHYIRKALSEKARMIRLPQSKVDSLIRIEVAKKIVLDNRNEKAELREIAQLVNMDVSQVSELLRLGQNTVLLGSPVTEDDTRISLEDCVEDDSSVTPEDHALGRVLRNDIEDILGGLKKKEAAVIRARYGLGNRDPMSLEEAGYYFKISKERVRQIETKALQRLQQPCRQRRLEAYVA